MSRPQATRIRCHKEVIARDLRITDSPMVRIACLIITTSRPGRHLSDRLMIRRWVPRKLQWEALRPLRAHKDRQLRGPNHHNLQLQPQPQHCLVSVLLQYQIRELATRPARGHLAATQMAITKVKGIEAHLRSKHSSLLTILRHTPLSLATLKPPLTHNHLLCNSSLHRHRPNHLISLKHSLPSCNRRRNHRLSNRCSSSLHRTSPNLYQKSED